MLALGFLLASLAVAAPASDLAARDLDIAARSSRPGKMYIHPQGRPNKCLTAYRQGQGQYLGARLYVKDCDPNSDNQAFRTAWGTTTLLFLGEAAQGNPDKYCVATGIKGGDDTSVDQTNGRPAMLWYCPPYDPAEGKPIGDITEPTLGVWFNVDRGNLKVLHTKLCLDVKDGDFDGSGAVQQWKCHKKGHPDFINQQWVVDAGAGGIQNP